MATCILPTSQQLNDYTVTPFQYIKDAEVEKWLIEENKYDFLLKLMAAWRSGSSDFTYFINNYQDFELLVAILTDPRYGYGYTVSDKKGYSNQGTQLPSEIPGLNNNPVRWSLKVSWA